MRIALFSSSFFPETQGVSVVLWERLIRLQYTSHEILLFCPDYSQFEDIYPDWRNFAGKIFQNVEVFYLPSKPFLGVRQHPTLSLFSYKVVETKLKEFKPDIIHSDDIEKLYFGNVMRDWGAKYAQENNIPCIVMHHTNFLQYYSDYAKSMPVLKLPFAYKVIKYHLLKPYSKYDLVLVSSREQVRCLRALEIRRIFYQTFVGVNTELFKPIPDKSLFLSTYVPSDIRDKVKVLYVGRLDPDKGWLFLIDALLSLASFEDLSNLCLIIAGYGPLETEILDKLSPKMNIHFVGKVSYNKISELYQCCDFFLTPSEKESRGLTILEAAACGIPALAPRAGGLIDSLKDGETGLFYNPGDKNDFIDKFLVLAKNKLLRDEMGKKARLFAEQNSCDKGFEHWISLLDSMVTT